MSSKKVIELFYDVVSPYAWLGFEVCAFFVSLSLGKLKGFSFTDNLWLQVMCRYRTVWNIELKFRPAFLGGVLQASGKERVVPNVEHAA